MVEIIEHSIIRGIFHVKCKEKICTFVIEYLKFKILIFNIMRFLFMILTLLLLIAAPFSVWSQESKGFSVQRTTILLDSTYDSNAQTVIKKEIANYRDLLSGEMNTVIGKSTALQSAFQPASPLSNLLTDLLFNYGNRYIQKEYNDKADLSLLNFGGIRNVLPEGDITVGDIYKIAPFENHIVIISLKGSELKKVFNRFTEKKNQPYSQIKMTYFNGIPTKITLNGDNIEDEKTYNLVTVDFIENGGDAILKDIQFDNVVETQLLLRDVIIEEIKRLTADGKVIEPIRDDRVIIRPQFGK